MTESLLSEKSIFIEAYKKTTASIITLYSSANNEMYWVGYTGMGSTAATRISPDLEEIGKKLLLESVLVRSGRTSSTPVDIGEPVYQYQELWELILKD